PLHDALPICSLESAAGDGEVLHGALRLRPVQGVGGHFDLAHGVAFNPVFLVGHAQSVSPRAARGQCVSPHWVSTRLRAKALSALVAQLIVCWIDSWKAVASV